MKATAKDVYDMLLNEERILELNGQIGFKLGSINLVVKQRDIIGSLIQEWAGEWLRKKGIEFMTNPNTQMPPDFFLDPRSDTHDLLEIKAFNADASPAFDIADFKRFELELRDKPYVLDVDYLIFAYRIDNAGIISISGLWLKKVWEITRRMDEWPLSLQIKKNVVHKIRPGVWFKPPSRRSFHLFRNPWDFVSAVAQTTYQNTSTREPDSSTWLPRFLKNYRAFYPDRPKPSIPRWEDIEDSYRV